MEQKNRELEERVELSLLYDFYGALLKESQRRMFEANVLEDYNFAEIAQEEGISRQGAYDAVKRASKQLRDYEKKLGLAERFKQHRKIASRLRQILEELELPKDSSEWNEIFLLLEELTDS